MTTNPFEVLRLDPTASEEEVVRQAGQLRQRAADEAALTRIRQAVQALTAHAQERRCLALLTHPRPAHAAPALERLAAVFRRAPAPCGEAPEVPDLDHEEFRRLLIAQVIEELDGPPAAFDAVESPVDPAEIDWLLAEALWQTMICDMRA